MKKQFILFMALLTFGGLAQKRSSQVKVQAGFSNFRSLDSTRRNNDMGTWDDKNSRNHPMFGGAITWFYRKLAGMDIDEEQPGYKHIIIRPTGTFSIGNSTTSKRWKA
jgi:hypothetical protein